MKMFLNIINCIFFSRCMLVALCTQYKFTFTWKWMMLFENILIEILAKNLPGFSTVLIETLNKNYSWILGHNFSTFSKVVYLTHSLSFFPFSTIEHRSIFLWQLHVLNICDFCKGWMLRHCGKKNLYWWF